MADSANSNLPPYLHSYAALREHFEQQFDQLSPQERGAAFADFVQQLVPLTDFGRGLGTPEKRQVSHDGGVDLIAVQSDSSKSLYVQSKYLIKSKMILME